MSITHSHPMTEMGETFGGLTLLIKSYSEVFGTWLNNFAFGAKPFIIFHKEMPAMAFVFFKFTHHLGT